jgi:hypothetical protein
MKGQDAFRAEEYGSGNGLEAVALVTGFGGNTGQLDKAAKDLTYLGRDVVVYDYAPEVLLDGEGERLPQLIDTIYTDFQKRTTTHTKQRFGGVSLGGAIAAGMQKQHPDPEPGLFAATGTNAAELIMRNRLFGALVRRHYGVDIRQAYMEHDHTLDSLKELWQGVNSLPDTAFSLTLGGLDYVIPYRRTMTKVANWRARNPDIQTHHLPRRGHTGTIKWFNDHCAALLERAA